MTSLTRKERILARLNELGAAPKRSLGQNFLVSDHVIDRILQAVRSEPFSEMIEVGPGLGALTDDLIAVVKEKRKALTLLELDRAFAQSWRERAAQESISFRVQEGDALQMNWRDLEIKDEALFVSNLPYQISSSLVIERSLEPVGITRMILMFQKEVAQRIAAKAKSPDYGLLTVIAQTFWETSTVCDAGPQAFYPPPNVASRVLQFKRRKSIPLFEAGETAEGYLKFVKAGFSHRRKLLSRNLIGEYFGGDKEWLTKFESLLVPLGLKSTARAEELDPQAFVSLYLSVRALQKKA